MFSIKWLWYVVFSRMMLMTSAKGDSVFVIEEDKKISTSSYQAYAAQSTEECAAFCQFSKECTAANYMTSTRMCYLFNKICVLPEDAPEWKYIKGKSVMIQKDYEKFENNNEF